MGFEPFRGLEAVFLRQPQRDRAARPVHERGNRLGDARGHLPDGFPHLDRLVVGARRFQLPNRGFKLFCVHMGISLLATC